jgi:hypothetical protein
MLYAGTHCSGCLADIPEGSGRRSRFFRKPEPPHPQTPTIGCDLRRTRQFGAPRAFGGLLLAVLCIRRHYATLDTHQVTGGHSLHAVSACTIMTIYTVARPIKRMIALGQTPRHSVVLPSQIPGFRSRFFGAGSRRIGAAVVVALGCNLPLRTFPSRSSKARFQPAWRAM